MELIQISRWHGVGSKEKEKEKEKKKEKEKGKEKGKEKEKEKEKEKGEGSKGKEKGKRKTERKKIRKMSKGEDENPDRHATWNFELSQIGLGLTTLNSFSIWIVHFSYVLLFGQMTREKELSLSLFQSN